MTLKRRAARGVTRCDERTRCDAPLRDVLVRALANKTIFKRESK